MRLSFFNTFIESPDDLYLDIQTKCIFSYLYKYDGKNNEYSYNSLLVVN